MQAPRSSQDSGSSGRPRLLRWARRLAPWLLAALLFFAIRAWQQQGTAEGKAPPLRGPSLGDGTVSLSSFRGEPVMVHFWASWCGVCDMMEANVGSVSEDYPVVTVASWSERDGALRKRAEQWSAPVVVDPEGRLARAFGVSSVPTTFVLDADGRIQHTEVGYTTELGLRARLWLAGF